MMLILMLVTSSDIDIDIDGGQWYWLSGLEPLWQWWQRIHWRWQCCRYWLKDKPVSMKFHIENNTFWSENYAYWWGRCTFFCGENIHHIRNTSPIKINSKISKNLSNLYIFTKKNHDQDKIGKSAQAKKANMSKYNRKWKWIKYCKVNEFDDLSILWFDLMCRHDICQIFYTSIYPYI